MKKEPDPLKLVSGQILPNLGSIVKHKIVWFTILLSLLVTVFVDRFPLKDMHISDLANMGLTFSAIALGGCFTTVTLALSLPGEKRISAWAKTPGSTKNSSALTDLVFVIIWAALCQIALIATCSISLIVGGDLAVFPESAGILQRGLIGFSAWVFFYALAELLIVVSTLSQVAVVVSAEEARK